MNGKNRHVKGSSYERSIAKKFSDWSGVRVSRTFASGASGSDFSGDTRVTGDLFFPVGYPNCFSIELKNHAAFNIRQLFLNGSVLKTFLAQNVEDADRIAGRVPMLVMHVNREDDYIVLPYHKDFEAFLVKNKLPYFRKSVFSSEKRTGKTTSFEALITNLNSFVKVKPNTMFKWYSNMSDYKSVSESTVEQTAIDKLVGEVK